jgi:hypothetical protein
MDEKQGDRERAIHLNPQPFRCSILLAEFNAAMACYGLITAGFPAVLAVSRMYAESADILLFDETASAQPAPSQPASSP